MWFDGFPRLGHWEALVAKVRQFIGKTIVISFITDFRRYCLSPGFGEYGAGARFMFILGAD